MLKIALITPNSQRQEFHQMRRGRAFPFPKKTKSYESARDEQLPIAISDGSIHPLSE
jgi:hypothetical protein